MLKRFATAATVAVTLLGGTSAHAYDFSGLSDATKVSYVARISIHKLVCNTPQSDKIVAIFNQLTGEVSEDDVKAKSTELAGDMVNDVAKWCDDAAKTLSKLETNADTLGVPAKPAIPPVKAAPVKASTEEGATADTAETKTTAAATTYRVVDVDDISVAPRKYLGKPIEVRGANCLYADVDDYRCAFKMQPPIVFVYTKTIAGDDSRKLVEEHCDTLKKYQQPKCAFTIRFSYDDGDRIHYAKTAGGKDGLWIMAQSITIVPPAPNPMDRRRGSRSSPSPH